MNKFPQYFPGNKSYEDIAVRDFNDMFKQNRYQSLSTADQRFIVKRTTFFGQKQPPDVFYKKKCS